VFRAATQNNCYELIPLTLDRDDQLRDDWEDLSATLFQHIEGSLDGKESVRVYLFSDSLKEDREVMMVVKLGDIHFPVDSVVTAMLDGDGKVSTIVEPSELR
jgi:hypothetical protein